MNPHFDVAVIGGGIVGLANAWMAARRGFQVGLFERTSVAQGASVRNFGMIWPIGQPAGELYDIALRSREFWLELNSHGVVDVQECGSIHLAHHEDECAVLEEFSSQATHKTHMISADEVLRRSQLANPQGLLGGMYSPTELRVDPRTASARVAAWLKEYHQVACHFETPVIDVVQNTIRTANGQSWTADRIVICSGSDLQTLRPEILLRSGLRLCKLQMLKSMAQPMSQSVSPHIASGLTLRHYASFASCPTLPALQRRIADESPRLDQYGIHVMASQFPNGEVILGDSHEYESHIDPFDKLEIDDLILHELRKVIRLDHWSIRERWHGIYAKHPTLPVFQAEAPDGVFVFVGTGGAGMTMSFGLADQFWKRITGEKGE